MALPFAVVVRGGARIGRAVVVAIAALTLLAPEARANFIDPAFANHGGSPSRPQQGNPYVGGKYAGQGVLAYGDAAFHGVPSSPVLPVVAMASTPTGGGYWLVTAGGVVYPFGDAAALGSAPAGLKSPIVGIAATPSGHGYWLAGLDGGVFAFGDAPYLGSMGNVRLVQPIVGIASTPTGRGYWMVAADGGIFSFGGARYLGSTGGTRLYAPVIGMAATPTGAGYWEVASDGGVFTFGDARFFGSAGSTPISASIDGIAATHSGHGYWLVADDGTVRTFGDARSYGDNSRANPVPPVAGLTAMPSGNGYWLLAPALITPTFGGASAVVTAAVSQTGGNPSAGYFCNPYGPCEEWCALFATWAWQQAGVPVERDGFTGDMYLWAARHTAVRGAGATPAAGDAVLYGTGPQDTATSLHVAIVAAVWPDGSMMTIDGDDGPGPPGQGSVIINGPFLPWDSVAYRGMPIYGYAVP